MSEARSRRAGGATQSGLMNVGATGPIIDPFSEFSRCGGREKAKSSDSSNRMKTGGGTEERNEYVPPRAKKRPNLCSYFASALHFHGFSINNNDYVFEDLARSS